MLSGKFHFVVRLVCLSLLLTGSGFSQDAPTVVDGIRIFEPSYYNEFDPTSALQLVYRTPGFNPRESSGGRGLAGVRSNVLIDGVRPPPKGQSVRQQLREMPVNGVQYIELIDAGARLDIDMQGYPQVVNVVTVEDAPAYYEVSTEVQRTGDGSIDQENQREMQIEATGSFSWRDHDFTLSGDVRDRTDKAPADFVAIDPANPVQRISSLNSSDQKNTGLELSADLSLPDSSLFLTSQLNHWEAAASPVILDDGSNSIESVSQSFQSENDGRDFSAEYRRPFGSGGEVTAAFVDAQQEQQSESSLTENGFVRSSLNDRESGETAARLLITQSPSERVTVRTTATTAFNYFEGGFRIFENGTEVNIQGSNNRVEEDRHSLEGAVDWNFSDRWTLSTAVGAEAYEITSSEASSDLQTDPTGLFSVSFRPQPRTTFKIESQRQIGQLSFNQFLASSNLSSEIITAGAAELEPERTWTHSASYDRRFGDRGVLRISLERDEVDNPVRSVALSDELIVAQNTSAQTIDSLNASIEFPFEPFGRDDLVLTVDGMVADSETVDPVTGETREASGVTESFWAIGFRRDPGVSRLAWGVNMQDRTDGDNYSVRRIRSRMSDREWEAYVEYEPIDDLKFRVSVQGPRTDISRSRFFGEVRQPGLDPSFFANTVTRVDRSASLRIEWRRLRNFEIMATISSRPRVLTEESLLAFGATEASLLSTTIAEAPRAWLRFRYYKQ